MKKLKNYSITTKVINNHKGIWNLLQIITFIPLIPFALLDRIGELFQAIAGILGTLRSKLVNNIFKLMYKNECNYSEDDED